MTVESFTVNITCWGAVFFEKWVICNEHNFRLSDHETNIIVACTNVFSWYGLPHFLQTTAPQRVQCSGKLSTINVLKRCKFNVNMWTLSFVLQQVPKSFKYNVQWCTIHVDIMYTLCWMWIDSPVTIKVVVSSPLFLWAPLSKTTSQLNTALFWDLSREAMVK